MNNDYVMVEMRGMEYYATFYLAGVKVATQQTPDLQLTDDFVKAKLLMLRGLAKGKALTTIESKH